MRQLLGYAHTSTLAVELPASTREETADESPNDRLNHRPASFLFVLLDCERPWAGGSRFNLSRTDEVTIGRGLEQTSVRECTEATRRLSLSMPSAMISAKHVRLLRVGNDWAIQDRASRNGTWLNSNRIEYAELHNGDVFQVGRTFFMFRDYEELEEGLEWPDRIEERSTQDHPGLCSLSPKVATAVESLRVVAPSGIPVLVLGDTGTGKELTAKAVHALSGRSGAFVAVNCGAIPKGLIESTLFGHVKGAFSGAVSNQLGAIRTADQGTLFLDEIGDLPLDAQATLLRVLQEKEVQPVGASKSIPVDFRVVTATHQPMAELVRTGKFRIDLYARLAGYVHQLPPLTTRIEDFGVLFSQILRHTTGTTTPTHTISTEACWSLLRHHWSCNIRELEQAIARAVVLAKNGHLSVEFFPDAFTQTGRRVSTMQVKSPNPEQVATPLQQKLEELMLANRGNVSAVARALNKGPTQIQRWLKRFQLSANKYREK